MTVKPSQRKAIETLLRGGTVTEAAQAADVSRQSLYRWMGDPEFKRELTAGNEITLRTYYQNLIGLADKALQRIRDILSDDAQPAAVHLKAADMLLSRLADFRETIDLEQRLQKLEELYLERKNTN